MWTIQLSSPDETRALGQRIGAMAEAGCVLALKGELGAGKTCLAQGIADGLGISGPITSPTFVLVQHYEGGRLPFYHADFYRLLDSSEIEALGWEDVLAAGGVVAVEWADRFPEELPEDHLVLSLGVLDEETRSLEASARGRDASLLLEQLQAE